MDGRTQSGLGHRFVFVITMGVYLNPPNPPQPGDRQIPWQYFRELHDFLRNLRILDSDDVRVVGGPGGMSLELVKRSTQAGEDTEQHPYEIYQHAADPTNETTDWRTVAVHEGYVNSTLLPTGTDKDSPVPVIVIPESTTDYKIWIDCAITTSGDDIGQVASASIEHGATGWAGYPDQPLAGTPGEAPAHLYILLGEVTTSDDETVTLTIDQHVEVNVTAGGQLYGIDTTPASGPVLVYVETWGGA